MICSVCSVFVHGYFCNFIISNGNHQNVQCAFSFMDPQRSIKFPCSVRVFGLCPKCKFRPDFFQKALFRLKMWKQTGTYKKDKNTVVIFSPNRIYYFCFWKKTKTISGQTRQWKVYKKSTLLRENNNNLIYLSEVKKKKLGKR